MSERLDLNSAPLLGSGRFDHELEGLLNDQGIVVRRNLLADRLELHRSGLIKPVTDDDLAEIRFAFRNAKNDREADKEKVADAISLIGRRHAYNPVQDYLAGLRWDGQPRLDTWLSRYLGAEDTPLNRAIGRKVLCAAVRRVKQPGCKFDHMLVLQGAQDLGKSSAIKALCHDPEWFSDQLEVGADPKVTIEKTAGAWVIEMPELDGMGKRDTHRVKSFITAQVDEARLAYARIKSRRPRQFVLFGTTNESHFLQDLTGNRRFWIVNVTMADPAGIAAVRDQLWAEAFAAEPNENLWLDDAALKADAAEVARSASDYGPWHEPLSELIPEGDLKIAASDLWRLVGIDTNEINKMQNTHRQNMRKAMAGLGFETEPKNLRVDGHQTSAYLRGNADSARWWTPSNTAAPTTGYDWS